MLQRNFGAALAALFLVTCQAQATELRVEIGATRAAQTISDRVEATVRDYTQRLADGSAAVRKARGDKLPFTAPVRVVLTQNGVPLPIRPLALRGGGGQESVDLIPVFDTTGSRAFPTYYKDYLVSVFASAKPAMDASFATASIGGAVRVLNYDADIPARHAVSGGIFVPNAPGGPEIHFPVYNLLTSAAVNYVHTLLLAYLGTNQYPADAYNEGFVRAATMKIARSGGAIPGTTPEQIELALETTYDVSTTYQWSNVPGLGAPAFVAPNLVNDPLPAGGSTGGIFLLRYQMAGTAWSKVLAEHPGFIAEFNRRFYLSPSSYQTNGALELLGQQVLDFLTGTANGTIEGHSFAEWTLRQSVLDTRVNAGLKLVPQAFPIDPGVGTTDFGVFGIVLNAFRTSANGNETLLNGTSYPVYWRPDFSRFFTSAQDDVIFLSGAYGSVAPNFPGDSFSNQVYRVAVDLPFQGKNVRVYLPAGAYATGQSPTPKNFYGTLTGFLPEAGASYTVLVDWIGGSAQAGAQNFAFGSTVTASSFEPAQPVTVRVFKTVGPSSTEVLTQRVNKGKGPLVLDLRSPGSDASFVFSREDKLKSVGIPFDPYRPNPADILGLPDNQTLVARWNPFFGRYDFYPDEGEFRQGLGYFVRATQPSGVLVRGLTSENTPLAVHLQPGWNLVTVPSTTGVTTLSVSVTTGTQAVSSWAQAAGTVVSDTFFGFNPDPVNPDMGTLVPSTTFEPGKAYFVKALKAEGAVLVFHNGGSVPRFGNGFGEAAGQLPFMPRSLGKVAGGSVATWRSRLTLTSAVGHFCEAVIGQQPGASDAGSIEDITMPAGPGGFQLSIVNNGSYYRDLRSNSRGKSFLVSVSGLVPGQRYWLNCQDQLGSSNMVVNGIAGRSIPFSPSQPVSFLATGTVMVFEVLAR